MQCAVCFDGGDRHLARAHVATDDRLKIDVVGDHDDVTGAPGRLQVSTYILQLALAGICLIDEHGIEHRRRLYAPERQPCSFETAAPSAGQDRGNRNSLLSESFAYSCRVCAAGRGQIALRRALPEFEPCRIANAGHYLI